MQRGAKQPEWLFSSFLAEFGQPMPDLLAIFNQLAKLLGLNADTRVAVVAVANDTIPAEKLIGWRRWQVSSQWLKSARSGPLASRPASTSGELADEIEGDFEKVS
jgi:hypothetical protein